MDFWSLIEQTFKKGLIEKVVRMGQLKQLEGLSKKFEDLNKNPVKAIVYSEEVYNELTKKLKEDTNVDSLSKVCSVPVYSTNMLRHTDEKGRIILGFVIRHEGLEPIYAKKKI